MTDEVLPAPHVTGIQAAYWDPAKPKTGAGIDKKDCLGLSRLIFGLMGVDEAILQEMFAGLSGDHEPEIKRWDCDFFAQLSNHDPQIKDEVLSQFVDVADVNKLVADRKRKSMPKDIALVHRDKSSVKWKREEGVSANGGIQHEDFSKGVSLLYDKLQKRMYQQENGYKTIIVAAPLSDNSWIDERKYSCHFLEKTFSDQLSTQESLAMIVGLQLLNNGNYAPAINGFIENSALGAYAEIEGELTLRGSEGLRPYLSTVGSEYDNVSIKIKEKNKYLRVKVDLPKSLFIRKKRHQGTNKEGDLHNFCYMMSIIMSHGNCFFYTLKIPVSPSDHQDNEGPLIYLPKYWSNFITSTYTKERTTKSKKEEQKVTDWKNATIKGEARDGTQLIYQYDVGQRPVRFIKKILSLEYQVLPQYYSLIYLDRMIVPDLGGKQISESYIYVVLAFNYENKMELIALEYNTASMERTTSVLDPQFAHLYPEGEEKKIDSKHWIGLDKFWYILFYGFKARGLKNVGAVVANGIDEYPIEVDSFFPKALKLSLIHEHNVSIEFMDGHYNNSAELMRRINNIHDASTQDEAKDALNSYNNYFQDEFQEINASWPPRLADVTAFIDQAEEFKVDIKDKKNKIILLLDEVHNTLEDKIKKSRAGRTPDEWGYTIAVSNKIDEMLKNVNAN